LFLDRGAGCCSTGTGGGENISGSGPAELLLFLADSSSILRGVTGLEEYTGDPYEVNAEREVVVALPGVPPMSEDRPGVMGMFPLVGLRGDSGCSFTGVMLWVGLNKGFSSAGVVGGTAFLPPRKSFLVENFRAREEPVEEAGRGTTGVSNSGVGSGYRQVSGHGGGDLFPDILEYGDKFLLQSK
jgi:hypothetical protein